MPYNAVAVCTLLVALLTGGCSQERTTKQSKPAPTAPPKPTCETAAAHVVSLCLQDVRCQKYMNGMSMGWILDECNKHFRERDDLLSCAMALKTIDGARECAKLGLGPYELPTAEQGG